jgi:photosystem II stability/assembly factor-like uncharacterized protein
MHTRRLAPIATAAVVMTFFVVAAALLTRSDEPRPMRTGVPAVTPEPEGAEEWMYLQRANPDGSMPTAAINDAIAHSREKGRESRGGRSTNQIWTELGPSNIGGRIRDVAADPSTKDVVYIATGSGGLWRSADGGQTFQEAWDHYLPQSMGAVAVDSKGVVWAGTGEVDHGGGSAYYGKGIYKSRNDGRTWWNMGLRDGDTIGQIVIDPRDDDRVFVAVMGALHDTQPTRGLFKTENGGWTWKRVLVPDSASTGGIDVTINKTNPDIMLATTWDKIRDEKSRIYGPHSYVYRSTNGGRTWTKVHNAPLPQSETNPALQTPDNLVGRMGVDFSDSDPNRAYLISSTARGNFNGFFTSADAGLTWTAVGPTTGGTLQSISGGFAWWFGRVYVDPVNPLHVFVAGVNLAESLDGGLTWTTSNTVHADQHGLEFDPFTPGKVLLGNDGGFYWSLENGRARGLWQKTPRLPVTQFYAMDVSVQDGTRVNAGSQDNGSLKSWALDNTVNGDWFSLLGGDGMMNRIDPTNDRKYYACSQNGGCRGFVGTATGQTFFNMVIPGVRRNWVAPLEFAADPRYMFGASEFVHRIDTEPGTGQRVWLRISPDITEGTEPRAPGFGSVTALGTTAADPNLLYAGTDSGLMWVTHNAMAAPEEVTWTQLESRAFPGRWVTRITVDQENPKIAWATFSGWRSGDGYPHIVMTRDGGKKWRDIAGKRIPQAPINDVIRHWSKRKSDWLFIATDVGVFRTTNLGKTWKKVGDNLPLVPVNDIDLPAGSNTLYAATYGRSVWTTSLVRAYEDDDD